MKLNEGLRKNDLSDLVLPLISIDEFESKVSEDAIVVGFFVKDNEPANDLNRFIQKSPVSLLDTEVSPAPNEDGYFLVFVEFLRDEQFFSKLQTIINEVNNLVDIDSDGWSFTCYGHEGQFDLTEEKVHVLIRTEPLEVLIARAQAETQDAVMGFLSNSDLDDVVIVGEDIVMRRSSMMFEAEILSYGTNALEQGSLVESVMRLDPNSIRECREIRSMLGMQWDVTKFNETFVLTNTDQEEMLCLNIKSTN